MNFESHPELGDAKKKKKEEEKKCSKVWSFTSTGWGKAEKPQGLSFPFYYRGFGMMSLEKLFINSH